MGALSPSKERILSRNYAEPLAQQQNIAELLWMAIVVGRLSEALNQSLNLGGFFFFSSLLGHLIEEQGTEGSPEHFRPRLRKTTPETLESCFQ